jgi:hypothetical protein
MRERACVIGINDGEDNTDAVCFRENSLELLK